MCSAGLNNLWMIVNIYSEFRNSLPSPILSGTAAQRDLKGPLETLLV